MSIEAVIWDFGGVFTTSPFEAFARYEREHDLPENFIRMINSADPDTNAWAQFERSEVNIDEFDTLFAAEAEARGHNVPGRDVIELLHGDVRTEMVHAFELIKTKYKTGCITNNVKPKSGEAFWDDGGRSGQIRPVMAKFDHVIESAKVGLRKPDPRIYEMMCEALSVAPANCIYLDDLGINCKPARAMGMTTIKVVSAQQTIGELEDLLGLALR